MTEKEITSTRWQVTPNPMRTDGAFVTVGPSREYEDGSPRLPRGVVPMQVGWAIAERIVRLHNEALERGDDR